MLVQLLVGSLVSAIAIMIHALATVGSVGVARAAPGTPFSTEDRG